MIALVRDHIIPAAYAVLPASMKSPAATAMLLAIGWHETKFKARRQIVMVDGIKKPGPATGLFQFEETGGTQGVLSHPRTSVVARDVLAALHYPRDLKVRQVWERLEHNDILACCFARLLLRTIPAPLPTSDNPDEGWRQYATQSWNPGHQRRDEWATSWRIGWEQATTNREN